MENKWIMSRCKSCNVVMTDVEMSRTRESGEPEDLCGGCGYIVFLDVEDLFIYHDYAFAEITEGVGGLIVFEDQVRKKMSDYS